MLYSSCQDITYYTCIYVLTFLKQIGALIHLVLVMYCSIPGCNYSRKDKDSNRGIFKVLRPDLGKKSAEEKEHYENLQKFLLQIRDFQKGDRIKVLLHKETACICENHFTADCIISVNTKKKLKLGSMPSLNLPKPVKEVKVSSS